MKRKHITIRHLGKLRNRRLRCGCTGAAVGRRSFIAGDPDAGLIRPQPVCCGICSDGGAVDCDDRVAQCGMYTVGIHPYSRQFTTRFQIPADAHSGSFEAPIERRGPLGIGRIEIGKSHGDGARFESVGPGNRNAARDERCDCDEDDRVLHDILHLVFERLAIRCWKETSLGGCTISHLNRAVLNQQ